MDKRFSVRPLQGIRAAMHLSVKPDDTEYYDLLVQAFEGDWPVRMVRRLRQTEKGRKLLRDKPDLVGALADRDRLRRLPEGTLGRAYLAFVEKYGISGDGLKDLLESKGALGRYREFLDPDELFVAGWLRHTHDLFHVLGGYGPDMIGEMGTLILTNTQVRNPGMGFANAIPLLLARLFPRQFPVALDARARARRAAPLFEQNWVELLDRPLDGVRAELGLGEPLRYRPFFSPAFVRQMKERRRAAGGGAAVQA